MNKKNKNRDELEGGLGIFFDKSEGCGHSSRGSDTCSQPFFIYEIFDGIKEMEKFRRKLWKRRV